MKLVINKNSNIEYIDYMGIKYTTTTGSSNHHYSAVELIGNRDLTDNPEYKDMFMYDYIDRSDPLGNLVLNNLIDTTSHNADFPPQLPGCFRYNTDREVVYKIVIPLGLSWDIQEIFLGKKDNDEQDNIIIDTSYTIKDAGNSGMHRDIIITLTEVRSGESTFNYRNNPSMSVHLDEYSDPHLDLVKSTLLDLDSISLATTETIDSLLSRREVSLVNGFLLGLCGEMKFVGKNFRG